MNIDLLIQARDLLENCTPLETNCGLLCGGACCEADEDGQGGVLLFPGERELLQNEPWLQIRPSPLTVQGKDYSMMVCQGTCDRTMRPLGCRIFPLTPIWKKGLLAVRMDRRAWAMCPLMASGIRGLSQTFVQTVTEALRLIEQDPEGSAFLREWYSLEQSYAESPFLL